MTIESPPQSEYTIEQAVAIVGGCIDQAAAMGANDSEIPELMSLQTKLRGGKIEPDEAISEARKIVGGKQQYH